MHLGTCYFCNLRAIFSLTVQDIRPQLIVSRAGSNFILVGGEVLPSHPKHFKYAERTIVPRPAAPRWIVIYWCSAAFGGRHWVIVVFSLNAAASFLPQEAGGSSTLTN